MTVTELSQLCESKVDPSAQPLAYHTFRIYKRIWRKFIIWLNEKQLTEFSVNDVEEFSLAELGSATSPANVSSERRVDFAGLIAIKHYILTGQLRSLTSTENSYIFDGDLGIVFKKFLDELGPNCSSATFYRYKRQLHFLFAALIKNEMLLNDINIEFIDNLLYESCGESHDVRSITKSVLRTFFHWCHAKKITNKDLSIFILKEKIIKESKLPSTFTEEETRRILKSIDRSSTVGKRDYAILLCISVYGWRSSDVCNLKISDIDWGNNKISFIQQKTNVPAEFPLHPVVGNAIVDYITNARPNSDSGNVFLLMSNGHIGKQMRYIHINALLQRYIKRASIVDLDKRKHGPHALRFSLATALVESEVPLGMVKSILGHKDTEVTINYIRLDIPMLKKCALPMPQCESQFYNDSKDSI